LRVDVGAALEQQRRGFAVAAEDRVVQRAPLPWSIVDARAAREQPRTASAWPLIGRVHDGTLVQLVGVVHIGAARDEQLHHRDVAVPGRDHEPRADAVADEVGSSPSSSHFAHARAVAELDLDTEGHWVGERLHVVRKQQQPGA
jgi:hypothetical protein